MFMTTLGCYLILSELNSKSNGFNILFIVLAKHRGFSYTKTPTNVPPVAGVRSSVDVTCFLIRPVRFIMTIHKQF